MELEESSGSEKEGNDLCCCLYSCYCYYCGCWASCWLKFLGWTQVILYSAIAVLSVVAMVLHSVTKETEGKSWLHFDWIEVMLFVSIWAPAPLLTIPFHLIQIMAERLVQISPGLQTGWTFFDGGRHMRGQYLIQSVLTLVFLLVGTYMDITLLLGIKQKSVQSIKKWTIYVGIFMGIAVIEGILVTLLDSVLNIRPWLSLVVHGFTLGAALVLLAELQKDTSVVDRGGGEFEGFDGIEDAGQNLETIIRNTTEIG